LPPLPNMNLAQSAVQGTISVGTPMDLPTASAVASMNAPQLIAGLKAIYNSSRPKSATTSHFQRIRELLLDEGRWDTLAAVRLAYSQLSSVGLGMQIPQNSCSSLITTKMGNSRASKPVISINIGARKPSTTIREAPPQSYQYIMPPSMGSPEHW